MREAVIGQDELERLLRAEFPETFNPGSGLVILEKDGQLHTLIEWQYLYPLKEISENVFQFPDYGLYMGDKITFTRDKSMRRKSRLKPLRAMVGRMPASSTPVGPPPMMT